MKKRKIFVKRTISMLLMVVMLVSLMSGCGSKNTEKNISNETKEEIIEATTNEILENLHLGQGTDSSDINNSEDIQNYLSTNEIIEVSEAFYFSNNWEDYIGDIETFVYGLIANELSYKYDVFPACVVLTDGTYIYGIAYTDYTECYTNEDKSICYFTAGLLPFCGELEIPEEEFQSGLILNNMDFEAENTSFIWTYASSEYTQHCVIYEQYLQYGVDENGYITFQTKEYVKGECDETLGSLYSYDEAKYLYDVDLGNYIALSGTTLSSQIDYVQLEKEINAILEQQDFHFASVNVESYAYFAQEAVTSYLLSLQEETFLGYDVTELIEITETLDPMQCIRITEDGTKIIGETELAKWLVGASCAIVTAVGMVGSMVTLSIPALSASVASVTGIAIEVFMQVVVENENLGDISWNKVMLSAVTGAVSGYLGAYVMGIGGISGFCIDTALDGLLSGVELAAMTWLEGGDGIEVKQSFGYGIALGTVLSASFKGIMKGIAKTADVIAPKLQKLENKVFCKLTSRVSQLTENLGKFKASIEEKDLVTRLHSEYIANKISARQLKNIINKDIIDDELSTFAENSINQLSRKLDIVDANGNIISIKSLKKLFKQADNGTVLGYIKYEDKVNRIVKLNGLVGVYFDNSYQSVRLDKMLTYDRDYNMLRATKLLKEEWLKNPEKIPTSIKDKLVELNVKLENIDENTLLLKVIKKSGLVLHENTDMYTVSLLPKKMHQEITHYGGVSVANHLKLHMGQEFFERFINAASSSVAGAIQ